MLVCPSVAGDWCHCTESAHPPACLSCCLSQQHIPIRTELSWSYVTISSPLRTDWVWLRPHRPAHSPSSPSQPFLLYFNSVCGDWQDLAGPGWPHCWPGPHLAVTPTLVAEHLHSTRRPTLELERRGEDVSSIGLYISTVTSYTARDQWEHTSPPSQSHQHFFKWNIQWRADKPRHLGATSQKYEYRSSSTKLSDSWDKKNDDDYIQPAFTFLTESSYCVQEVSLTKNWKIWHFHSSLATVQ